VSVPATTEPPDLVAPGLSDQRAEAESDLELVNEASVSPEPSQPVVADGEPSLTIEEGLAEIAADLEVPEGSGSVMVVVVDADGAATHVSAGQAPDGSTPTPDDTFRVGSITKVFTALATLTLVDEGLVDLDASASEYVSRLDVPEEVTVRDLLAHTSGLPNDIAQAPKKWLDADPSYVWTPEETYAMISVDPLQFAPGTRFAYSNTNYIVLGVLIEEVTSGTAAEAIRTRIVEPLGLDDTYLAGQEPGAEPFSTSDTLQGAIEPINFDYTSIASSAFTAGSMVSSASDLHRLFRALAEGEIVSAESFAAMTADNNHLAPTLAAGDWGFGLEIGNFGSTERLIGHSGQIVGYDTRVLHSVETGRTAFVVSAGRTAIFDDGVDGAPIDLKPAIEAVAALIAGDQTPDTADDAATESADALTELNVAYWRGNPTPAGIGQFDNTFDAALGLKVNWYPFSSSPDMAAALDTGEIDIAWGQNIAHFANAVTSGSDHLLIGVSRVNFDANCVVAAGVDIDQDNAAAQLAGQVITRPVNNYSVVMMLEHLGVDMSSVETVETAGGRGAVAEHASGDFAMTCDWPSGAIAAMVGNGGSLLMSPQDLRNAGIRNYQVVAAPRGFVDAHRGVVTEFLRVANAAIATFDADPGSALTKIATADRVDPTFFEASLEYAMFPDAATQLSDEWLGGAIQRQMRDQMSYMVGIGLDGFTEVLDSYDAFVDTTLLEDVA
jgi:D-alanyl-D-alanine carboxypeptidase